MYITRDPRPVFGGFGAGSAADVRTTPSSVRRVARGAVQFRAVYYTGGESSVMAQVDALPGSSIPLVVSGRRYVVAAGGAHVQIGNGKAFLSLPAGTEVML